MLCPNVVIVMESNAMRWAGQVVRIVEIRYAHRIQLAQGRDRWWAGSM
jgi:hypothetical protein